MDALARHVILDYYGCQEELLDDVPFIERALLQAAESIGATVVASKFHQFSPFGVSGTVVIAESHLTIHTWPEHRYAAIDVFTCGDIICPREANGFLLEKFMPEHHEVRRLERGRPERLEAARLEPFSASEEGS